MSSGAVARPVCRRSERWAEVARLIWRKRSSGERGVCRERRGNEGDLGEEQKSSDPSSTAASVSSSRNGKGVDKLLFKSKV